MSELKLCRIPIEEILVPNHYLLAFKNVEQLRGVVVEPEDFLRLPRQRGPGGLGVADKVENLAGDGVEGGGHRGAELGGAPGPNAQNFLRHVFRESEVAVGQSLLLRVPPQVVGVADYAAVAGELVRTEDLLSLQAGEVQAPGDDSSGGPLHLRRGRGWRGSRLLRRRLKLLHS